VLLWVWAETRSRPAGRQPAQGNSAAR
jgi:hypothetical protein